MYFRYLIHYTSAGIQLLDFTNSLLVSIHTGQAKLQTGNFKLIHVIDLDEYENAIYETSSVINTDGYKQHHLFPYISHELEQIRNLIENLKPKNSKRSLNFIGSAWKWVAGNPDHDDFITIKQKLNNVLVNNNKQVIINNLFTERLNNLTRLSNDISNSLKNNENHLTKTILNVEYKIKILKEDLVNINYAIHWAKSGIINSLILSRQEIKVAINTFRKENLPFQTVEEALNFSEIKILTNFKTILYIVNIPITDHKIYEKITIKPVKKIKIATEILYETILKNDNEIFGIKENCKTLNFISICKTNNVINLTNTSCIPNIFKSLEAKCNIVNNQHIPTIEEISPGIILLNNFNGTILVESIPQNLNGTYLIKFNNISITVNNRQFTSREESQNQILPAILYPLIKEREMKRLLSLEMMDELHVNNTNTIEMLQLDSTTHRFSTYGIITVLSLILLAITIKILRTKGAQILIQGSTEKPEQASKSNSQSEDVPESSSGIRPKFNDIPFF